MSVLDIKNDLLRLMWETNDPALLEKVRLYFTQLKQTEYTPDEITAQEDRMLNIGMAQIENGEVMSHKEARKRIDAMLKKK